MQGRNSACQRKAFLKNNTGKELSTQISHTEWKCKVTKLSAKVYSLRGICYYYCHMHIIIIIWDYNYIEAVFSLIYVYFFPTFLYLTDHFCLFFCVRKKKWENSKIKIKLHCIVSKINLHTKYAVNRHTVHFTLRGHFQGHFKWIKIHAHALSTTQCAANIPISI